MAKSKFYRRSGAQSNGQHAYRQVANVGRLELRARGRCRILFVGSCTAEWPKYTRHRRYPWNADGSIAASRESDGSSFAESHDAHPLSLLLYMVVDTTTTGPRRAGAHRPSLVPEAVNLTRPSHLSPNSDHASASTRHVLALPRVCRERLTWGARDRDWRDRCKGLLLRAAMGGLARLAASKPHAGGNIASQMRTALLKHTTSAIARSSGARKDHF